MRTNESDANKTTNTAEAPSTYPAVTFLSREELVKHLKSQYEEQGVVLTIKRSKSSRVVLKCDRGGTYKHNHSQQKRKTHTRLTGCSFEIVCSSKRGVWAVRKIAGAHNHALERNLSGHSVARRLTSTEKQKIVSLSGNGIPPRAILTTLRSESNNPYISAQEIHNTLHLERRSMLRGRKPIEAFIDVVSCSVFFRKIRLEDDVIQGVFFAHKESVKFARRFSTIFFMDCTYKTNKFGMPLLNIIGITATYHTFNAAFVFLTQEDAVSYQWALQQFSEIVPNPNVICTDRELALMNSIKVVFPDCGNLLCRWHINKNILTNCKKYFQTDEEWITFMKLWNAVVSSLHENEFEENVQLLQSQCTNEPVVFRYVNDNWLPHKHMFVSCFVNNYPHFGSTSTSRVEGNHHTVKTYIRLGNMDLLTVLKRIDQLLANQIVELNKEIEREKIIISHHHRIDCFQDLHYKVSQFALDKLLEQFNYAVGGHEGSPTCTGMFTNTYGLPCKHEITNYVKNGGKIPLSMIHPQWRLNRLPTEAYDDINGPQEIDTEDTPWQRLLKKITNDLYSHHTNVGSIMTRIEDVLDTPFVQIAEPEVVTKKRGRPAGAKNKSRSITRDKSAFEYAEG